MSADSTDSSGLDPSIMRALISAATWGAVATGLSLALGLPVDPMTIATDAGLMGGASMLNDKLHTAAGLVPGSLSSAAATGAIFAGLQKVVKGSEDYVANAAAGALNDFATEQVALMIENMYAEKDASDFDDSE